MCQSFKLTEKIRYIHHLTFSTEKATKPQKFPSHICMHIT